MFSKINPIAFILRRNVSQCLSKNYLKVTILTPLFSQNRTIFRGIDEKVKNEREIIDSGRVDLLDTTLKQYLTNDVTSPEKIINEVSSTKELPLNYQVLAFPNQYEEKELDSDGYDKEYVPIFDDTNIRRVWSKGSLVWDIKNTLKVGEEIDCITRVKQVVEKGDKVNVDIEKVYSKGGIEKLVEIRTLTYLPFPSISNKTTIPDFKTIVTSEELTILEKDDSSYKILEFSKVIRLTDITLMRYSGLTYNSHRIHWDRDYTRNVEGYPDLINHGPLLLTLLINYFRIQLKNHPLTKYLTIQSINYNLFTPTFVDEPITLKMKLKLPLTKHSVEENFTSQMSIENHLGRLAVRGMVTLVDNQ